MSRYLNTRNKIFFQKTYVGIPLLGYKLNLNWEWKEKWKDYYIDGTNIIDAAVLWKDSYIKDTFMCISFQFQKH